MSAIRFVSGQVLFRGGSVGMAEACCCDQPCNCLLIGPRITPCYECISTPYPATTGDFGAVNDWEITISGVANGTATTPGGGTGCFYFGSCNTTVSSHTGLFNATHLIAPCSTTTTEECHYLGCQENFSAGSKLYAMERNRIQLTHSVTGGVGSAALHIVGVTMRSSQYLVLAANGASEATLCAIAESSAYFGISVRTRTLNFQRDPGLSNTWRYDPSDCTEECNEAYPQMSCVSAGWSITKVADSSTNTACRHALDFSGATVTVEAT